MGGKLDNMHTKKHQIMLFQQWTSWNNDVHKGKNQNFISLLQEESQEDNSPKFCSQMRWPLEKNTTRHLHLIMYSSASPERQQTDCQAQHHPWLKWSILHQLTFFTQTQVNKYQGIDEFPQMIVNQSKSKHKPHLTFPFLPTIDNVRENSQSAHSKARFKIKISLL